jgi:hypothetical protein
MQHLKRLCFSEREVCNLCLAVPRQSLSRKQNYELRTHLSIFFRFIEFEVAAWR